MPPPVAIRRILKNEVWQDNEYSDVEAKDSEPEIDDSDVDEPVYKPRAGKITEGQTHTPVDIPPYTHNSISNSFSSSVRPSVSIMKFSPQTYCTASYFDSHYLISYITFVLSYNIYLVCSSFELLRLF